VLGRAHNEENLMASLIVLVSSFVVLRLLGLEVGTLEE